MSNENKTEAGSVAAKAAIGDLSDAIERSVEREPGEEVRIVRVFDDNYRCNWWMRDSEPGPMYMNIGRITRSKFLKATMSGEKLIVEDLSSVPPK